MDERKPVHTGGCQCGNVRYAIYAEPTRPGICHCRMCQRAVGNPFHAFAGVARADFEWTHQVPGVFQSSQDSERSFCRSCGTPLTYDYKPGDRMTFGIATLDEPAAIVPDRSIGIESKLPWVDRIADFNNKTSEENAGADYVRAVRSNQSKT